MVKTNLISAPETQELSFLISPYFSEEDAIKHFMQLAKDPTTGRSSLNKNSTRQYLLQVKLAFRREHSRVIRMADKGQFQELYLMERKYLDYQYRTIQDFISLRKQWLEQHSELSSEGESESFEVPSRFKLKELSINRKRDFANKNIWDIESRNKFLEADLAS